MTYITAPMNECYNPTYFNILEHMEYELLAYEQATLMESYFEGITEADEPPSQPGASYDNRGSVRRGISTANDVRHKIGNKLFGSGEKLTKGQAFMRRIKEFFRILKEKIKQIVQAFMQKVDELFKLNDKFIRERLLMITGINDTDFWDRITVDIWNYSTDRLKKSPYAAFNLPRIDSKSVTLKNMLSFKGTEEEFDKTFFKVILQHKGDKDGFKEACKNFFREAKSTDDKMDHLSGNKAKDRCIHMAAYLRDYKESYAKPIRNAISEFNGAAERVDRDFEGGKLADYLKEAYYPMFEQDQEPNRPGVHMDGANSGSETNARGAAQSGTETFNRMQHYVQRLFMYETARMTIAEEFYFAALRILKYVYSNAEKHGKFNKQQYNQFKQGEEEKKTAQQATVKQGNKGNAVKTALDAGPD